MISAACGYLMAIACALAGMGCKIYGLESAGYLFGAAACFWFIGAVATQAIKEIK